MFCIRHRWTINSAHDDQREIPAATRAHLETCASCRHHHKAHAAVAAALLTESRASRAPEGLAGTVARQLRRHPSPSTKFALPAWAMAAVALALAVLIWQFAQPPTVTVNEPRQAQPPAPSLPAAAAVNISSITDRVAESVTQPYTEEMNRLRQDFVAARDFLAASIVARP